MIAIFWQKLIAANWRASISLDSFMRMNSELLLPRASKELN